MGDPTPCRRRTLLPLSLAAATRYTFDHLGFEPRSRGRPEPGPQPPPGMNEGPARVRGPRGNGGRFDSGSERAAGGQPGRGDLLADEAETCGTLLRGEIEERRPGATSETAGGESNVGSRRKDLRARYPIVSGHQAREVVNR